MSVSLDEYYSQYVWRDIYVPAKRHAPYGFGRGRRFIHRCVGVTLTWHNGTQEPSHRWERPFIRAAWACGPDSTRPTLIHEPADGDVLCPACEPFIAEPTVYFARSRTAGEHGLIKIGWSSNVPQRLRAQGLIALATMPGTYSDEQNLHRRFAKARVIEEWFEPVPELLALIERVAS